jgi:hypothetical protein
LSFLLFCISFAQSLIFGQGSNKKKIGVGFLDIILTGLAC